MCEPQQLKEFLSSALVSISDQSLPLEGLQLIFQNLYPTFLDDIVQVCWSGIGNFELSLSVVEYTIDLFFGFFPVHHSIPVRLNSARLLKSLTDILQNHPVQLETLIPPLITLSSDTEARIRLEIVPCLCNMLFARIQEEKILTVFQVRRSDFWL